MDYPADAPSAYSQLNKARSVSAPPERPASHAERITSRLGEQNRRLNGITCTISEILSKLRGERAELSKGAPPRPVRSGLLGTIEDEQDAFGERLDTLNELANELRELI